MDIQDELLTKFMLGQTTPEENRLVENWIASNQANEKYYGHFKILWESSRQLGRLSPADENEAWNQFKERRDGAISRNYGTQSAWWRTDYQKVAAAVCLLIVSIGVAYSLLLPSDLPDYSPVTIQTRQNVRTDTLPDGSVVTVNKNSRLTYPSKFTANQREVKLLDGEAFFKVVPQPSKPFFVRVADLTVQVVGTSFNVKHSSGKTEVIVETGSVWVSRQNHQIRLKPREKIRIEEQNRRLVKEPNADQLYAYYRSKEFVLNQTPLWRLVEVLSEAYGVRIVIASPEIRDLTLNTTFNKNQSLDIILSVIEDTFKYTSPIKVEKTDDNQIILKKAFTN